MNMKTMEYWRDESTSIKVLQWLSLATGKLGGGGKAPIDR